MESPKLAGEVSVDGSSGDTTSQRRKLQCLGFFSFFLFSFPLYWLWWFEYAWPIGSGTVRRCGLVGGSVSLWGQASRSPVLKLCPKKNQASWLPVEDSYLLLSLDQVGQLSAPLAPCLPGCCHVSHHDYNGLNL